MARSYNEPVLGRTHRPPDALAATTPTIRPDALDAQAHARYGHRLAEIATEGTPLRGVVDEAGAAAEMSSGAEGPVQAKEGGSVAAYPDVPAASGGGQPLPPPVRGKMERSFGHSFEDVRIHSGAEAEQVGALAYTRGDDVHFQPGLYDPLSLGGQELLGHELTHVVQQRAGRVSTPQPKADGAAPINADAGLEAEADAMGRRAAQGKAAPVVGAGGGLQRKADVVQRMVLNGPVGTPDEERIAAEARRSGDAQRMQADQQARAASVYAAKGVGNQSQEAQDADWAKAGQQQQAEIGKIAEKNWMGRFTQPTRPDPLQGGQMASFIDAPVGNGQADPQGESQATDWQKAQIEFRSRLFNQSQAVNPTGVGGNALNTSGIFETPEAPSNPLNPHVATGPRPANLPVAPINQHVPDPANPGRLPQARMDSLLGVLSGTLPDPATGRTTDKGRFDPALPHTPIPRVAPENSVEGLIREGKDDTDPAVIAARALLGHQNAVGTTGLGGRQAGGAVPAVQGPILNDIHDRHSHDVPDPHTGGQFVGPLGHSHSAHGAHLPHSKQADRVVYGIRPDEVNTVMPPITPAQIATTPTGGLNVPGGISPGLTLGPGLSPAQQQDNDRRTDAVNGTDNISQYGQTNHNSYKLINGGMASQFADPVAEYQAFNLNFAEAWQNDRSKSHQSVVNPATGANFTDAEASRVSYTNSISNPDPTGANPLPYGFGFKIASQASGGPGKLDRRPTYGGSIDADAATRIGGTEVLLQNGVNSVIEKQQTVGTTGTTTGFRAVTNFPSSGADGRSIRTAGNVDTSIGGLYQAPYSNAVPNPKDDAQELTDSLTRIGTSTNGSLRYPTDALTGVPVRDPITGQLVPLGQTVQPNGSVTGSYTKEAFL